jgi:hypothetical protein
MSSRKRPAPSFEPAVLLGGAGYGAWTECDPAHRLADAFAQVVQIRATAPAHEREEVVYWLIRQWKADTSPAEGRA